MQRRLRSRTNVEHRTFNVQLRISGKQRVLFIRRSVLGVRRSTFILSFDVRRSTLDVHLLFSSGVKAARPTEKAVRPDGAGADGLAVSRLVSCPATGSGV